MNDPKPKLYVSALLCGDVIREKDTDMLTAVRILAGVIALRRQLPQVPGNPHTLSVYDPIVVHAVINIWGEGPRQAMLELKVRRPDGKDLDALTNAKGPLSVGGGSDGLTLNTKMSILPEFAGTYFVEIYVDGELYTKLPLTVLHQPKETARTSSMKTEDFPSA